MSVPTLALAVNVVDDYVESTAAQSDHSEPLVDRRRCGSGAAGSSRCHRARAGCCAEQGGQKLYNPAFFAHPSFLLFKIIVSTTPDPYLAIPSPCSG
ncbi:hypothetical protein L1887_61048 [Cichorium endivia]|nr:hypothetical protein L1887_61048 [Cichorium endivia]